MLRAGQSHLLQRKFYWIFHNVHELWVVIHSVSILFSKKFPQLTMRKFIIHFSIVLPFLVSIFFKVLLKQNQIIFYCVTQYRKMPSNFLECMLFKLVTFVNCLLNLLRISVLKFEFNKKVSTGTYLLNTFWILTLTHHNWMHKVDLSKCKVSQLNKILDKWRGV